MKSTQALRQLSIKFFCSAAVVALFVAVAASRSFAQFNIKTEMVPMRDGVRLATDVYFPESEKKMKRPTVLVRTPYGRVRMGAMLAPFFTSKNFIWIIQDTRGRNASEGVSSSFLDDADDGLDTLNWVTAQPWSNGKIGTAGVSAMGITQFTLAKNPPDSLVCQHVMAAPASLYHTAAYQGGALKRYLIFGWLLDNKFPLHTLQMMVSNTEYNGVWERIDLTPDYGRVNYPIMHMAGWYDMFLQGNLDAYVGIRKNGGPAARDTQLLVIGPWTHMGFLGLGGAKQGDLVYPVNSVYDIFKLPEWFQECLLGRDKGYLRGPKVRYYVMGDVDDPAAPGNEWRTADNWPVHDNAVPYYFHSDGSLSASLPGDAQAARSFVDDPANPVPSIGGANLMLPAGPRDQSPIEGRDDVLVFSTPVLSEPLEITGRIKAVVHFTTDVVDTDIAVRLTDVYPDGRSMLITDGFLRASSRESDRYRVPLKPGQTYQVEVDLWSTSIIINKGHKLRAVVSGSSFPRFDVNMHNGRLIDIRPEPLEEAAKSFRKYASTPQLPDDYKIANTTIHLSKDKPSHLLLPVPAR